ncbi:MAG: beta-ketoacyl-ACP synthase [Polyangiaceae bacterium]
MNRRRVAVTGIGVVSPIGDTYAETLTALRAGKHGITVMREWDAIPHLTTRLAAPARAHQIPALSKKLSRTMGRVSQLSTVATAEAIADAGLDTDEIRSGSVGLAYGSTHGSSSASEEWVRKLVTQGFLGLASTTYLKFMSHTAAANLALYFGIRGRVISTCAACVSASQAIGAAYEAIKLGVSDVMIAGGAEELHFSHAGVFEIMYATSRGFNDTPERSPRPFDARRDGLVVGEGAGTFIVEEWERAKAKGRRIYAEIVGYGTNCDGTHATNPSSEGMSQAMRLALEDAKLAPSDVHYVNAHATGTVIGDATESHAMASLFGARVPVSSLKGHMGHTLGACGAIEAALAIGMMREGFIAPTRNLEEVDPKCAQLDYVRETRERSLAVVMSNKFAFGGLNTSLLFRRV